LVGSPLELVQPLARAGQILRVGYSPYRTVTAVLRKAEPMRKGSQWETVVQALQPLVLVG
jgi:hypothetical protein